MISVTWLDGGSAGYWVGQREKALACFLSIRHRSRNRSRPGQGEGRVDLLGTGSSTGQATRRGNSGSATQPRSRSALKLITYPSADGCAWVLGCAQFLAAARLLQPHLRNWICSSWLLSAHVPMKTAQQKASSSTRPPRRAQLASEPSPVEKEGGARSEFLSLACPTVGQQARFASNAKLRPEPAQPFLTLGCSRGCEPPPRDEASQRRVWIWILKYYIQSKSERRRVLISKRGGKPSERHSSTFAQPLGIPRPVVCGSCCELWWLGQNCALRGSSAHSERRPRLHAVPWQLERLARDSCCCMLTGSGSGETNTFLILMGFRLAGY